MTSKRKEIQKMVDKLSKKKDIHFERHEIERLITQFLSQMNSGVKSISEKNNVRMERTKFREILYNTFEMTDDVLLDRVFRAFDRDNDNYINVEEWVHGLSVFLKGTVEEKMKFCFTVYDLNSDGFISREEMFQLLKHSLHKASNDEDADESVKELVELALKRMDHDHDSRLSFMDYKTSIGSETLLIEFLGSCLPDRDTCGQFLKEIEGGKKGILE